MTTEPLPVDYGCDWPVDPACLVDEWDELDEEIKTRAVDLASATLRRLTGYRVGGCPITVRPCKPGCRALAAPSYYDMLRSGGGTGFWPHINEQGVWVNSCGCATGCSCTQLCEIELPPPVGRVDAVWIDGQKLDDLEYRVDDGNRLIYLGTEDCPFPACQDMTKPFDSEGGSDGTFAVTYLNAYPVDSMGAYAAGTLAMEFARACSDSAACRLPANVVTISRQGVSMEVAAGTFPNGTTGIREVDSYIGLWNPDALRQDSRVWTPQRNAPRVMG